LSRQQSLSLGAAQLPAGSAAAASVPVELQRSFLGLARAQKLRRRWLLVKVWNRWQQLLRVSNTSVLVYGKRWCNCCMKMLLLGVFRVASRPEKHDSCCKAATYCKSCCTCCVSCTAW
jgi:hypothetical protein